MLPFKNYKGPPNEDATEKHRGLMTASMVRNLNGLGAVLGAQRSTNLAVPATTSTTLLTLDVTEGEWYVVGQAGFTMGGAAASVDIQLLGQQHAVIGPIPAGGFGSGFTKPYRIVGPTTVTLQVYAGAACTCNWVFGVGGNATTSIYAVRVG